LQAFKFSKIFKKKLKNESLKKYIKIESKKIKELENKFLSNKLTVHFSADITLNKDKIFAFDYDKIRIYDNKYIVKIADIDFDDIKSSGKVNNFDDDSLYLISNIKEEEKAEDNNCFEKTIDIIIDINEGKENVINNCFEDNDNINYILKTYKYNSINNDNMENNKKYFSKCCSYCVYLSIQSVIGLVNKNDFLIKLIWEGHKREYAVCRLKDNKASIIQSIRSDIDDKYNIISISPLSEKRFLVYLDNGINIFCLHQKYNIYYSEIFINKYYNPFFKRIYEVNNIIIICSAIIKIENDYKSPPTNKIRTSIQNLDSNKKILFLRYEKIMCNEEKSGQKENSYKSCNINFSNCIILKKKYFIFMADNNLIVLSLLTFEIIKNYSLFFYYDDNFLIYKVFQIEKWDEINDNEFIINVNGNITLFELTEDNSEIGLNILAYYYFPRIIDIQKVDDNNRYCQIYNKKILFY